MNLLLSVSHLPLVRLLLQPSTFIYPLLMIIILAYAYHALLSSRRKGEVPIIWSWIPVLGHALEFGSRPIDFMKSCAVNRDIFGIVVAGNRMIMIADPFSFGIILRPRKELSYREFHKHVLESFFGVSSVATHILEGIDNVTRAMYGKLLYSDRGLSTLTLRMEEVAAELVANISNGEYPLLEFLGLILYQASTSSLMNKQFASDPTLYASFMDHDKMLALAMAGFNVDHFNAARKGKEALIKACHDNKDVMSEIFEKRVELFNQHGMPKSDIDRIHPVLLWAAVANTIPTAFWTMYYILSNATIRSRVMSDIAKLECKDGKLDTHELDKLEFLDACITEALRLSSGSLIMRFVNEPCEIEMASGEKYLLRKGDRVGLCPFLVHRDPEIYPNPDDFLPDRWLVGTTSEQRAQGALGKIPLYKGGKELEVGAGFLAFGGGPLLCPGRRFARNEVKYLMYKLLSEYDISLEEKYLTQCPGFDSARAGLGIFPPDPKDNVKVRVARKV